MIKSVILSSDRAGGLSVRLSFEKAQRPVVKVLQNRNVSVGINADGVPVYVRLEDAHTIDRKFKDIAKWGKNPGKRPLSRAQKLHLEEHCITAATELTLAYQLRNLKDEEIKIELCEA